MVGLQNLWVINDNFVATTFRNYLKNAKFTSYMKQEYEVTAFCSSRFSDSNTNLISRLQITFADAVNAKVRLPDYIIVILDDDIIQVQEYKLKDVSTLYGIWLEWLLKQFNELITGRLAQLPSKSKNAEHPFLYFLALPTHTGFDDETNYLHTKFNLTLESVVCMYKSMKMAKIKEVWHNDDSSLVVNNRITDDGYTAYWQVIDTAVNFNILKRKQFLIREAADKIKQDMASHKGEVGRKRVHDTHEHFHDSAKRRPLGHDREDMKRFFKRKNREDRYHWSKGSRSSQSTNNRFMLPCVCKN